MAYIIFLCLLLLFLCLFVIPVLYTIVLTILVSIFGDTVIAHVILIAVYILSFLCIFIRRMKKMLHRKNSEKDEDISW